MGDLSSNMQGEQVCKFASKNLVIFRAAPKY